MTDLARNMIAVKVRAAEKRLLRARDVYEEAAAKIQLEQALRDAEAYKSDRDLLDRG